MSGVDKLEITLNDHPESNIVLGVLIEDLIKAASSINYANGGKSYRKEGKNSAIKLTPQEEGKGNIIIEFHNRALPHSSNRNPVPVATKLIINPNHFNSWDSLDSTIQSLNANLEEPFITLGFINRIDFNADIDMNPSDFRRSIDIKNKQVSKTYFDSKTGQTETVYWGKDNDVLLFYDRHQLFDSLGRDDLMTTNQSRMRIERQIRKPRLITKLADLPSHPTYNDFQYILTQVANGNVSPLEQVVMGDLTFSDLNILTPNQIYEMGRLSHTAESVCYGYARRQFNGEEILDQCNFISYSDSHQPTARLAEAITEYLQVN